MSAPTGPAAGATLVNSRPGTVQQILGNATRIAPAGVKNAAAAIGAAAASLATPETGNYWLKVLFYLFLYAFFIFLIAVLVHFTVRPVFSFKPGSKGLLAVPGTGDDKVYWNDRTRPAAESRVPAETDTLASYEFENNFSFSIDVYIRKILNTEEKTRVILFKSYRGGAGVTDANGAAAASPFATAPGASDTQLDIFKTRSSMAVYLTNGNDLVVEFYSGTGPTIYSSAPIKNIPLYTPFRLSVVVETKVFTVYINGRQAFQRVLNGAESITLNTAGSMNSKPTQQRFYTAPAWADAPTKSIFVQNLHLWPRVITAQEIAYAQPSLAAVADFDAPPEPKPGSCSV